jgi:hypothetical protein
MHLQLDRPLSHDFGKKALELLVVRQAKQRNAWPAPVCRGMEHDRQRQTHQKTIDESVKQLMRINIRALRLTDAEISVPTKKQLVDHIARVISARHGARQMAASQMLHEDRSEA